MSNIWNNILLYGINCAFLPIKYSIEHSFTDSKAFFQNFLQQRWSRKASIAQYFP